MRAYPCCVCPKDVDLDGRHVLTADGRRAHILCTEGKDWPGAEIVNPTEDASSLPPAPVGGRQRPRESLVPEEGF